MGAVLTALLLGAGCGSSTSDSEVTVETGSLSKAEFIKKADAICEVTRKNFNTKFSSVLEKRKSAFKEKGEEEEFFEEVLELAVTPTFEKEVEQISTLGAPKGFAPEVAVFLNTLQRRIDEAHGDINELMTRYPFEAATDAAQRAGMQGCAESLS